MSRCWFDGIRKGLLESRNVQHQSVGGILEVSARLNVDSMFDDEDAEVN